MTTSAARDAAGESKNQTRPGPIKRLFRAAVKAVTRRHEDEPTPARRRRRGETGRAFYAAGRTLLYRARWLPPQAFAAARFLSDTIDWLTYWHPDTSSNDPCDNLDKHRNDLSLRM